MFHITFVIYRLVEVDQQIKKAFKRTSTLLRGLPDSKKLNEISKNMNKDKGEKVSKVSSKNKPKSKAEPVVSDEEFSDEEMSLGQNKSNSKRGTKASKRSRSYMLSETSETLTLSQKYPRINKLRNSAFYLSVYYF